MKRALTVLLAIGLTFAASAGNELPLSGLKKEIGKKIIIDLSRFDLSNQGEVIDVQFEIVRKEIQIKSISGAKRALIDVLRQKLESLKLDDNYDENQIYRFRFTFENEK